MKEVALKPPLPLILDVFTVLRPSSPCHIITKLALIETC